MTVSETAHPRYSWRVKWREGTKERNAFFHSEKRALAFAAKKRKEIAHIPRTDSPPTPDESRALHEARRLKVPLMEAITHWSLTAGKSAGMKFSEFVDARIESASKDKLSGQYVARLKVVLGEIREGLGNIPAASVTPLDCRAFIERWKGHASQKQARAALSGIFSHAVRMGWALTNPATSLKLATRETDGKVAILSAADAADWLLSVATCAPSCLAGWSIAMFAGLRRSEVERLDWSEVRLDRGHIEVTASKSKTRTRRLVDIQPNLADTLEPLAKKAGSVLPHSPKNPERWARKAYGRKLPKNVARHSFVSYHLALFGDLALTELQAGHDRKVLFQHYRELVTKDEAESYFTIGIANPSPA